MNEQPHRTWIVVIVAIIGAAGVIIAAIISLGMPFAERMADRYYPSFTPIVNINASVESTPQAVQPTAIIQQTIVPTFIPIQPPVIATNLPTPTPIPPTRDPKEILCPFAITQSEVNSLNIGLADVSTVRAYIKKFDDGRPGDGGAFPKGITIPAGVIVATNFDEVDANKWSQYPVIAIVHSGSWGLFQTTGEYIAPNAGACRVIIP